MQDPRVSERNFKWIFENLDPETHGIEFVEEVINPYNKVYVTIAGYTRCFQFTQTEVFRNFNRNDQITQIQVSCEGFTYLKGCSKCRFCIDQPSKRDQFIEFVKDKTHPDWKDNSKV